MKVALLQLKTLPTPEENLEKIKQMLVQAKQEGADLAVLPEMCCCPYENSAFVRYAMPENAPFLQGIAEMAGALGLYVVAGSVPLAADGRIYNAAFVYDNRGSCIARHRKTHLFDINVPGGQYFMESDTFTAGRDVCHHLRHPVGQDGVDDLLRYPFSGAVPSACARRRKGNPCPCRLQYDNRPCPLGNVLPYACLG